MLEDVVCIDGNTVVVKYYTENNDNIKTVT